MKAKRSSISRSALALAALTLLPSHAQLAGQLGVLDPTTANGGINPTTGAAWAEGDTYRLIFLSSTTSDAMSSDITTYNAFAQETAAASTAFPDLGSATWNVLGSTLSVDARDNTGTNQTVETGISIFLTDGTSMLAANNAELWRVPSAVPVTLNENGIEVANPTVRVFTGSFNDGRGVGAGGGGGADGDGGGTGDTALGVLTGQGVQTGQPVNPIVGSESDFWIRQWKEPAANPLPFYVISEPLSVIVGTPQVLAISAFAYDFSTQELNLTWSSKPGEVYLVKYSLDMVDWTEEVVDSISASEGTETSESFDLSQLNIPNPEKLFFRVERMLIN